MNRKETWTEKRLTRMRELLAKAAKAERDGNSELAEAHGAHAANVLEGVVHDALVLEWVTT